MSLGSLLHSGRVTTPEQHLVFAILATAVVDLFGRAGSDAGGGSVRREALSFLTAGSGPWAQRRREECEYVSIDADELRRLVIAILEGKAELHQISEKSLHGVADARALWASQKPVPSPVPRRVTATPTAQTLIPKIKPQVVVSPATEDDDANRTERRKTVMRMLKHSPATVQELSAATGRAITGRQVAGFLHHAEKDGLVQRDGDLWSLIPQASKRKTDARHSKHRVPAGVGQMGPPG